MPPTPTSRKSSWSFGGYKQSGFDGRDNGLHAHDQYTELKTIWVGKLAEGVYSACCQNGLGTAQGTLSGILAAEDGSFAGAGV